MNDSRDSRDSRIALRVLLGFSGLVAFLLALIVLAAAVTLPGMSDWVANTFDAGIGLKNAAILAAFLSVGILVLFALVAGDGLIGEFQFLIPGFFLFFAFFWLMVAWIF